MKIRFNKLTQWFDNNIAEQTDYRWCKKYGSLNLDQAKSLKEVEKENTRLRKLVADLSLDKAILKVVAGESIKTCNKTSSSVLLEQFDVSERSICRALSQPHSFQRYLPTITDGKELLIKRMIELAVKYGRYGYRRIAALL
jgi:hypothetical protein